jgi:hypothetical protein
VLCSEEGGDLFAVRAYELPHLEHQLGALAEGNRTPRGEGDLRAGDRPVDLVD